MSLFEVYEGKEGDTFEEGWRNKLIWGDNLLVMGSLLEKFAGKIDLIYIDPPFATGADFSFTTQVGEQNVRTLERVRGSEKRICTCSWSSLMSEPPAESDVADGMENDFHGLSPLPIAWPATIRR